MIETMHKMMIGKILIPKHFFLVQCLMIYNQKWSFKSTLLAKYYGQSENHFCKLQYQYISIPQTWNPYHKSAGIFGKTAHLPMLLKLFETWFPYFTKWLSNWCHYTLSIWQTWFPFLKKWMTCSKAWISLIKC